MDDVTLIISVLVSGLVLGGLIALIKDSFDI